MTCEKCAAINTILETNRWKHHPSSEITHYQTFTELKASAEKGCSSCKLFQVVLLRDTLQICDCPEDRQRVLDSRGIPITVQSMSYRNFESPDLVNYGMCCFRQSYDYSCAPTIAYVSPASKAAKLPSEWGIDGRLILPQPDFELAKGWLDDCDARHRECQSYQQSDQPKIDFRVLDLGPSRDANIRLTTFDGRSRYATLSHCWGTSQPTMLKKQNVDEFEKRIAFKDLPKTFQDAIEATRCLGLRYLWIDSLCIIQDSGNDWRHQCAIMCDIYSNSYVTLAGPNAENCDSGFLHERIPLAESDFTLTHNGKPYTVHLQCWDPKIRGVTYYMLSNEWPLMRRAWVLQERLLSRRVLYFTPQTMVMQCFQNFQCENYCSPVDIRFGFDLVRKTRVDKLDSKATISYWQDLIKTYSRLSLSDINDKLPALSGLATRFAQDTGFQYLAGIWQEHLPETLA
ncbi:heterokaryon incompatibility protein-domain-containing protein [Rostrohypoxylon terebratum]|nr:heterokaryon incompatibility protein-domain-containing protein [Rostrohypoxylon terebratum]